MHMGKLQDIPRKSRPLCRPFAFPSYQLAKQYNFAIHPAVTTFKLHGLWLAHEGKKLWLRCHRLGRSASRISWIITTALVTKRKSLIAEKSDSSERKRENVTFIPLHSLSRCIARERTTWPIDYARVNSRIQTCNPEKSATNARMHSQMDIEPEMVRRNFCAFVDKSEKKEPSTGDTYLLVPIKSRQNSDQFIRGYF